MVLCIGRTVNRSVKVHIHGRDSMEKCKESIHITAQIFPARSMPTPNGDN